MQSADHHERRILDALRLLVAGLRRSSVEAESATGLSSAQLFVLRAVVNEPGLGIADLASRTLTHQSSVSVVVAKLEERGLLGRQRSASDGRRLELKATPQGRRIAAGSPDPLQERFVTALRKLPPTVRRRLAGDLARWVVELGLAAEAPAMFFEGSDA